MVTWRPGPRSGMVAAVALAAALNSPAVAGPGRHAGGPDHAFSLSPHTKGLISLPVRGGGQVAIPVEQIPTALRTSASKFTVTRGDREQPRAEAVAPSSTGSAAALAGPRSADEAAQFPAVPDPAPGTVVSVAGGYCDGYPALAARISPIRPAVDAKDGTLWWTDDDGSVGLVWSGPHPRSSLLLRHLDADGRVRTLGPLFAPDEGRAYRQHSYMTPWLTDLVPDGKGGTFVNLTVDPPETEISSTEMNRPDNAYGDVPTGSAIWDVHPDGTRSLIVGGQSLTLAQIRTPSVTQGDGDPIAATALGFIESYALDDDGNIFLIDSARAANEQPGVVGETVRLRFANRGADPVVLFPGTPSQVAVPPGRIQTIAGSGVALTKDHGDGGPAKTASFAQVPALAFRHGVLYLLDDYLNEGITGSLSGAQVSASARAVNLGGQAVKVAGINVAPGTVQRIAGDPNQGYGFSGDGGPATAAQLHLMTVDNFGDLAVARNGDIDIVDAMNLRLRRVDATTGVITTIAGNGAIGDATPGTPPTQAPLWRPTGVAIDSAGHPVVADYNNSRLRTVTRSLEDSVGRGPTPCGDEHLATGTTVNSGATFGSIRDVATDSKGNVYVADGSYNSVRRVAPDGTVSVVAGVPTRCAGYEISGSLICPQLGTQSGDGGPADRSGLAEPSYLLVDTYDNLYITDIDRIRYVNFRNHAVSVQGVVVQPGTIATLHTFPARSVHIHVAAPGIPTYDVDEPLTLGDLALDAHGNLFVSDGYLDVVDRIGPCGELTVVVGNGSPPTRGGEGDGQPAAKAGIVPAGLAYDAARDVLYIYDTGRPVLLSPVQPKAPVLGSPQVTHATRIRAVNFGTTTTTAYGLRLAPGVIDSIVGAVDCNGDCSTGDGSSALHAGISGNSTLALARDGRLYFADNVFNRLRVVLPDGRIAGIAGPWPQVSGSGSPYQQTTITPSHIVVADGYLGDGGPALRAWFTQRWIGNYNGYNSAPVALTASGDLVFADYIGRIRRILDSAHAPLRLSETLPALAHAGEGFGTTVALRATVESAGAGDADLVSDETGGYVIASRGPGAGCDLWRVTDNSDGQGHDGGGYLGQPSAGATASSGGRFCAIAQPRGQPLLGTGPRLATATSGDVPPTISATVLTAASDDGAKSWRTGFAGASADRVGGFADLGRPALAAGAQLMSMAFINSSGTLTVATSPDGTEYAPAAHINSAAASLGDLVVTPDGHYYLAFIETGKQGANPAFGVSVAASGDGLNWKVSHVTAPAGTPYNSSAFSAPSLAVDGNGQVFVAWSDAHAVSIASSADGSTWSQAQVVPGGTVNVLPTVSAVGDHVVVAFYGTPVPRLDTAANPYADWYVYVATGDHEQRFRSQVATSDVAFNGSLCTTDGCGATSAAMSTIGLAGPAEPGRVRARISGSGALQLGFTVQSARLGNASDQTAPAYLRSCFNVLAPKVKLAGCSAPLKAASAPPPAGNPPPDVRPPAPDLSPVIPCSPAPPPPAPAPAGDGHPAPAHRPVPPHHAVHPPVAAAAPFLEPPAQPALPAGQAPAQAFEPSSAGQSATQPGAQPQSGIQVGVAGAEEAEERAARAFGYTRPHPLPPMAVLWWTTTAVLAAGFSGARRRRVAPAFVRRDG